jgi:hypothetical protein
LKIRLLKQSHHCADIWTFEVQVGPWRVCGFRYNALTRGLIPPGVKTANGRYLEVVYTESPYHWRNLRDLIEAMISLGLTKYDPQSPGDIAKMLQGMSRLRLQKLIDRMEGNSEDDDDDEQEHGRMYVPEDDDTPPLDYEEGK